MFTTIINDCRDENAMGRQATRAMTLLHSPVATLGVKSDLEAAGSLIDVLDASEGQQGVILVNVAPRHGRGKNWPNGTPFGYFFVKKTLVVATIDGHSLSLAKKLGLMNSVNLLDVPTVIDEMIKQQKLDKKLRDLIVYSQFRSYDFIPRVAKWLMDGIELPNEAYKLDQIEDADGLIWWVDNFGNCKTTALPKDVAYEPGKKITTKIGEVTCYEKLRNVPNDEAGVIVGSSGYDDKRFLELVMQGKNASEKFNLASGSPVFSSKEER